MRKNFGAKPLSYPQNVFIIGTYDENESPNAMNAAWGGISEMEEISLCLSENHKTVKNILKRKAFTVSMGDAEHVVACDYVGIVSANKVPDKFARAGFHATKSTLVDAPLIDEFAARVNMSKYLNSEPTKLSGGQKQRVWIAMALAQDTKVLFLDEPTTYLDVRYQLQILKLIQKLNREYGITIVMVLHDINQSLYYSDEIVAMKDGRMIAHGLPEEIITKELVQEVYGVDLTIQSVDGKPFVIPV